MTVQPHGGDIGPGKQVRPRNYRIEQCPTLCSLNPRQMPAGVYEAVHAGIEAAKPYKEIVQIAASQGYAVSERAIGNHKHNHLVAEDTLYRPSDMPDVREKKSDLEILDKIIQAGARTLDNAGTRIGPEMTLKAMELRLKLTQGSVFDDFMAAVGTAFGAPEAEPSAATENVAAQLSGDEQEQAATDEPE